MKTTLLALLSFTLCAFISQEAYSQTTFSYTGAVQTFTVPVGVTSLQVETWGAQGANATVGATTGGLGGYSIGTLSVTPGEILNIYVGGQNGYNGGGLGSLQGNASTQNGPSPVDGPTGGGASDVRQGGTTLNDRVIVGGGGGGAGNDGNWSGCQPSLGVNGGNGGALVGITGQTASNSFACNCVGDGGVGGGGGTQAAGGAAGGYSGSTCMNAAWNIGSPGALGVGGDGDQTAPYAGDGAAGGGGGGYYGGGAAGAGVNTTSAGGGGGGSSYIGGVTSGVTNAGIQSGDGSVVITTTCSPLTTTVSATAVCLGETVTLHAESTNGGTITWDNGITDNVAFTPTLGGTTYTATSSDGNDCSFAQLITVNPLPTVDAGVDVNMCGTGTDITLSGSGAVTYVWDNGITDGVSFTPNAGVTTYTVTGTDANNCENTDVVVVTIGGPLITAVITHEVVANDGAINITVTGGSGTYTYVWSHGPTTEDVVNLVAGTYTVTVDDGVCTTDKSYTVLNVAGIVSLDQKGLNVYPNPTDGMVYIQLDGGFTYVVHDILGQTITTGTATGTDKFDLDAFENGVYFLQISDGNIEQTIKLVKQ